MSREVAVSAPGKAILMGEHAAVYGHPALVSAVDVRLTVTARAVPAGEVQLAMPAIGWSGSRSWDEVEGLCRERPAPVREAHHLAFIAAGETVLRAGCGAGPGLELTIVSEIPPGSGLGSSAALAVGVAAATLAVLGARNDPDTVARVALAVEQRQHGRPSGVDVQAVLRGGVLWCRRGRADLLLCSAIGIDEARRDVFRLFHAGAPGETTGEMVASVRRLAETEPGRVQDAMNAIERATHETLAVLTEAPSSESTRLLIPLVRRAEAALESLGVVPEEVQEGIRAIEAAGGAAKISGAGGLTGGAGLVLVVPPEPAGRAQAIVPPWWRPLPVALGAAGLREEVAA